MKFFKKVLIWLSVTLIFIVVGSFFAASYFINSYKSKLESKLSNTIGYETRIDGPISIKVMPGLSFVINKLTIISNETYLARAAKIEIGFDYTQIFSPQTDITVLHFTEPQLYVARNGDGSFNFDNPEKAIQTPGGQSQSKYRINLSEFSISDGKLLYLDYEYGDTLRAEGVNLLTENIALSGTIGNMDINRLNLSGKLDISKIKLNSLMLDSLNLVLAAREGKMSIEEESKPFFGGTVNGKLLVDFNEKPILVFNQHKVANMDIEDFLSAINSKPYLSGKADYTFELTFRSLGWQKAMKTMNGQFSLNAQNLELKGMDIDNMLASFENTQQLNTLNLAAVFMIGPYGAVFTKGMDFNQLLKGDSAEITHINRLVSDWTIKNGIAKTRDVAFNTKKYRLASNGTLDFTTDQFKGLTFAVVYRNGCPGISQTFNGLFVDYQSESTSYLGVRYGTTENLIKILSKPSRSNCKPYYYGSVEHPK